MKACYRFLLPLAALLFLSSCAGELYYTAAPIDARVVFADTGQPIEGAVVVANWQLVVGGIDGPHERGQLEVKEAVTDSDGRFHFDGFTKMNPMLYELRNEDPRIVIFKPGYEYKIVVNHYSDEDIPGSYRESDYNGKTISLKKHKAYTIGNAESYYGSLDSRLHNLVRDCQMKSLPRMMLAMDQEKKRISAMNPDAWVGLISIDDLSRITPRRCESPSTFFKGHAK